MKARQAHSPQLGDQLAPRNGLAAALRSRESAAFHLPELCYNRRIRQEWPFWETQWGAIEPLCSEESV